MGGAPGRQNREVPGGYDPNRFSCLMGKQREEGMERREQGGKASEARGRVRAEPCGGRGRARGWEHSLGTGVSTTARELPALLAEQPHFHEGVAD